MQSDKPVRKHTVIIHSGDVGAEVARKAATECGLFDVGSVVYPARGTVRLYAYAARDDKTARSRWVKRLRQVGLTVEPAPWEKREHKQGKRKPNTKQAAEAMRRIAGSE